MSKFFEEKHCSPEGGSNFSCFTKKQIKDIARGLNKLSKRNSGIRKIKIRGRTEEEIYRDIEENIIRNSECDKEACMLSLEDLMSHGTNHY